MPVQLYSGGDAFCEHIVLIPPLLVFRSLCLANPDLKGGPLIIVDVKADAAVGAGWVQYVKGGGEGLHHLAHCMCGGADPPRLEDCGTPAVSLHVEGCRQAAGV